MTALSPSKINESAQYLPLFVKGSDLKCLIVGGGEVAFRKITLLLETGAQVTLIAKAVESQIAGLNSAGKIRWIERAYRDGDVTGDYQLIIAATDDNDVNHRISEEAHRQNILVNVVDDPDYCSVVFPAVWRKGALVGAVGTGATAPFLSKEIRDRLQAESDGWVEWLEWGGKFRELVMRKVPVFEERRDLYKRFVSLGLRKGHFDPPPDASPEEWLELYSRLQPAEGDRNG